MTKLVRMKAQCYNNIRDMPCLAAEAMRRPEIAIMCINV